MNRPSLGALLLAFIPFVAVCFSVPLWDHVYPMVLGLPFNLFWLMIWIPLTSLCLWGSYRLHVSQRREQMKDRSKGEAE